MYSTPSSRFCSHDVKKNELTVATIKIIYLPHADERENTRTMLISWGYLVLHTTFVAFGCFYDFFFLFFVDSVDKNVCLSRYIVYLICRWALMPLYCYGSILLVLLLLLLLLYWRIHISSKSLHMNALCIARCCRCSVIIVPCQSIRFRLMDFRD